MNLKEAYILYNFYNTINGKDTLYYYFGIRLNNKNLKIIKIYNEKYLVVVKDYNSGYIYDITSGEQIIDYIEEVSVINLMDKDFKIREVWI